MSTKRALSILGGLAALALVGVAVFLSLGKSVSSRGPGASVAKIVGSGATQPVAEPIAEPAPVVEEPALEAPVEAPVEVAAEPKAEEPTPPWTFRARVNPLDTMGNPAPVAGTFEIAAFGSTGKKIASATFEADKEGVIESPFWPAFVAVSGTGPSMMMARGSFDMPLIPPLDTKAWKAEGDVSFEDAPPRRVVGVLGDAVGRFRNNGQPAPPPQVAFEFDTVAHAAPRFDLSEMAEDVEASPDAARSITFDFKLAVAYCGDIDATVTNLATQELLVALQSSADQDAFAAEHGALTVSLLRRQERTDGGSLIDRPTATVTTGADGKVSGSVPSIADPNVTLTDISTGEPLASDDLFGTSTGSSSDDPLAYFSDGFEAVQTVSLDRPWRPQPREDARRGGQGGPGGNQGGNQASDQGNRWNRGDRNNRRGGDQGQGGGGGRFNRGDRGGEEGGNFRRRGERGPESPAGEPASAETAPAVGATEGAEVSAGDVANSSETATSAEGASAEPADAADAAPTETATATATSDATAPAVQTAESAEAGTDAAPAPVVVEIPHELVPGREPNSFRQAQRAFMMESQPIITGNRIVFAKVPPGEYVIDVRTNLGRSARTEPFIVRGWETAKPVLTLEGGASLAVKVIATEKEGKKFPLKGARVELRPERGFGGGGGGGGRGGRGRGSEIAYNASGGKGQAANDERVETTGADGVAAFSVVEQGRWEAIVSYEGFTERRQSVQVSGEGVQTITIELPTEKAKVNIRLVSTVGIDVPEGKVLATRRRVFFRGPGRQAAGGGGSNEVDVKNGRAEMELDYGTWFFQGVAPQHQTTTLSEVVIDNPGPIDLVVSLPPLLEITAHVTRLGQPVAATPITFFSRAESTFGPNIAATDAEGYARLEAAPGSYAVYANRRYLDAVEARLDSDNFFELKMDGFEVDGYIRDAETGAGIDRANIRLVQQLDASDAAYTIPSVFRDPRSRSNEEGYFRVAEVPGGSFTLEVIADGYASLTTDPFEVNEETSGTPKTYEMKKAMGKIAGFVRRDDGSPVGGIIPRQLFNESMAPYPVNYRGAMSRDDGAYEIDNLEPGLYIVQFAGQPWRGQNYLPALSNALEVKAGETYELNVTIWPAGSLRISVRDAEGIAVGGVALSLVNGAGEYLSPHFADSPDPISDVAGEFHWTEIPPGTYRVYGTGAGVRQTGEALFATVEADATGRVTLTVERVQ